MKVEPRDILIVLVVAVICALFVHVGGIDSTTLAGKAVIFVIVALLGSLFVVLYRSSVESYNKLIDEFEPVFQQLGFVRAQGPASRSLLARLNDRRLAAKEMWVGNYRGRQFQLSFFVSRGWMEGYSLSIVTPNRTGKRLSFELNDRNQMAKNGLGEVCQRLDSLGMYDVEWDRPNILVGHWELFEINSDLVIYALPGSILSKENFKTSLEIICETLDRLGI